MPSFAFLTYFSDKCCVSHRLARVIYRPAWIDSNSFLKPIALIAHNDSSSSLFPLIKPKMHKEHLSQSVAWKGRAFIEPWVLELRTETIPLCSGYTMEEGRLLEYIIGLPVNSVKNQTS
ncbi:hypothetical protein O181_037786 [Austropuccinia psidii MF-1]|uniref:Uncharacterized protein n=1 Tax=Austropuccinia psidii MF-1 TaxID=1389203 RepID=A0A9Q3HB38_9BASI|nr:hypothetical protein [Austropuccinia psidii MF-1]